MKFLGVVPPFKGARGWIDNEENAVHFRRSMLEAAEIVDGWLEGIDVKMDGCLVKRRVAPTDFHLENFAKKLRISSGEKID